MPTKHNWSRAEIVAIMQQPFNDLLFKAHTIHREHFEPNEVQISTLLSIKTGACPEDCSYCPQSFKYSTEVEPEKLMPLEEVLEQAKVAKEKGANRFCMGAAWRSPSDRNIEKIVPMIEGVRAMGLETCMTLGMLNEKQAHRLKDVGLDYYNHNLDTSPEFYGTVISTRTYDDRLDTLEHVREAGMNVCSGGILGMGESTNDRAGLLQQLANMPKHPESVPINNLVQVEGTPLVGTDKLDPLDFIRVIATARILMPKSYVRLSAGRTDMTDECQTLCFFAGANSIFYGDKLLTTDNPEADKDQQFMKRLGLSASHSEHQAQEKIAASQ